MRSSFLLLACLTASGLVSGFRAMRSVKQLSVATRSLRPATPSSVRLSLAKKTPPLPPAPVEKKEGVEPKYLAALGVFIAAAIFDFFKMHGGVAIWDAGYIP